MGTNISDVSVKCPRRSKMPHMEKSKEYSSNIESHGLGKADTQASRPCAIIGPDRTLPPSSDGYEKSGSDDLWHCPDYRQVYDPIKMSDYPPSRNISPRQTFQENMQRIMVPPTYSSIKNSDESSFKNTKLNMPPEAKYCEVPFNSELKSVRNDVPITNANPTFIRSVPPNGWQPGMSVRPIRPYPTPDFYQYQEFPSCAGSRAMPINRTQRGVHEETAQAYSERLYQEANIRFKPYPTSKDRYPQTRYDYISNCPTTFHPPAPLPHHKFDIHKSMQSHPYPMYPQVPLKYLDRRIPEPIVDGFQRPTNPQANVSTFHNHMAPPYGPIPGNYYQNKAFPYQSDSVKPVSYNKLPPYDPNNKIYLELENPRNKLNHVPDNFYYADRAQLLRGDVLPSHPISMPQHPMYRKDILLKNYEYGSHYRNIDQPININNNLSRLPLHFSPNSIAISPCDSNTSNETTPNMGTFQEDCGYVSQSSTTSMRSLDSSLANDPFKRHESIDSLPYRTHKTELNSKKSLNSSGKKGLSAKQFLEMWNEGDEEDPSRSKEILSQNNSINVSSKYIPGSNQDQLYVLDLVNVPNEELCKYDHLQKISKLPENIKGYNNIEILNQYEQLVETPTANHFHVKSAPAREFQISTKKPIKEMLPRPLSPLDVEAKISQSVIHKDVGCNFEIKPCSPKILNVDVATPVNDILNERLIEKVTNPLMTVTNVNMPEKSVNIQPSCNLSQQYSLDVIKPDNYSIPDIETNTSLCLASLPQLDNDIELNFPEVNQQFINANKVESTFGTVATSLNGLPHINTKDKAFLHNQDVLTQSVIAPVVEKESKKLSKYRKIKKKDLITRDPDSLSIHKTSMQQLRIDSVIIKNPDTVDTQNVCEKLPSNISDSINNLDEHTLKAEKAYDNIPVSVSKSESRKLVADVCDEMAIDFSLNKNFTNASDHNTIQNSNKTSPLNLDNEHNVYNFLNSSNENDYEFSISSNITNTDVIYKDPADFEVCSTTGPDTIYNQIQFSKIVKVPNSPVSQEKKEPNITNERINMNSIINVKAETPHTEKLHTVEQLSEVKQFESQFQKDKNHDETLLNKLHENLHFEDCSQHNKDTNQDILKNFNELQSNDDNALHSKSDNSIVQKNSIIITGSLDSIPEQNYNDSNTNPKDLDIYETGIKCGYETEEKLFTSTNELTFKHEDKIDYKKHDQVAKSNNDINSSKSFNDLEKGNEKSWLEVVTPKTHLNLLSESANRCGSETLSIKQNLYSRVENSFDENVEPYENIKEKEEVIKRTKNDEVSLTSSSEVSFDMPSESGYSCSMKSEVGLNNTNKPNIQICNEKNLAKGVLQEKNVKKFTDIHSCDTCYSETEDFSNEGNKFEFENTENFNTGFEVKARNKNEINLPRDTLIEENKQLSLNINNKTPFDDFESIKTENSEQTLNGKPMVDTTDADHEVKQEESLKYISKEKHEIDINIESGILNKFKIDLNDELLLKDKNIENDDKVLTLEFNDKLNKEIYYKDYDKKLKPPRIKCYQSKAMYSPWMQKLLLNSEEICSSKHNYNFITEKRGNVINKEVHVSNVYKNIKPIDNNVPEYCLDYTKHDSDYSSHSHSQEPVKNNLEVLSLLECNLLKTLESDMEVKNNVNNSHDSNVSKVLHDSDDIGDEVYKEISTIITNTKCNEEDKNKLNVSLSLADHSPRFQKRSLKRCLSESALEAYYENDNTGISFSKRSKIISTDLCNILQANRRNSISEIYNENNVFILIEDNNFVLTDENETERLCYTEVVRIDNDTEINNDAIGIITDSYVKEYESNEPTNVVQNIEEKSLDETWVEDVACVETIYSCDIAEDIEIRAQGSPNSFVTSNYEEDSDSNSQREDVIEHMEKVIDIYGGNLCNNDAQLVETLFRTPQMNVDKTLINIESHNTEKSETCKDISLNVFEDEILESNGAEVSNFVPGSIISFKENDSKIVDNKENLKIENSLQTEIDFESKNKINTNDNLISRIQHDNYDCTVHSWEENNEGIEFYDEKKQSPNSLIPSSPEVSSTTSEDKNSNILLKISNFNGSRISQIKEIDKGTINSKLTFKLTESKHYKSFNSNYNTTGVLITKAAQKYIPPIKESMPDFKVKLCLPQHSLNKLKQLKISKVEPKIDKKLPRQSNAVAKHNITKKEKPRFEDVLLNIDKFQYKRHKKKDGKVKNIIPKVVIKKNESGSHYASCSNSTSKDTFNPDLTGRKWQPWVFLEKNNFVDKMAIRNKQMAIFCHRKNDYVLAEKFRKYKSIYNANFIISQPKLHDSRKGNLKYTIRLKHLY